MYGHVWSCKVIYGHLWFRMWTPMVSDICPDVVLLNCPLRSFCLPWCWPSYQTWCFYQCCPWCCQGALLCVCNVFLGVFLDLFLNVTLQGVSKLRPAFLFIYLLSITIFFTLSLCWGIGSILDLTIKSNC